MIEVEFPEKLRCIFEPRRYKTFYGGRGGAKSWSIARYLLLSGAEKPLRILCTREVQKSIKQSVHKLLSDQIQAMGLGSFYEVQESVIKGANGTEIVFAGLSDLTAESIKSYEGIDKCFCEEAQVISKRSWDILIPTIRKPDSEILISLNPELDTDETYQRMIVNPPEGSIVVQVNYSDNPWFPEVLEMERQHAKATMPLAEYENIWEGKCKPAVSGAIYADEVAQAIADNRICDLPYDAAFKVHVIFDLGWNDQMSIILAQRHMSALRVIEYIEDNKKTLDWCSAELKKKNYNWGEVWLPHDGGHGDFKTGLSAQQIMQNLGWQCGPENVIERLPIEIGIRTARMALPRTYFDRTKTDRLIQCLRRYRRGIPSNTGEPGQPIHDEWSHGADCYRYLATIAERMGNESSKPLKYPNMRYA